MHNPHTGPVGNQFHPDELTKNNAFAPTGRIAMNIHYPGRCPGLCACCPFGAHCARRLVYSSTCSLVNSSTRQLVYLSTRQLVYSSTCLLVNLPTRQLVYLFTCQLYKIYCLTPAGRNSNVGHCVNTKSHTGDGQFYD